ncbi:SGNH/GDSL hydrolase family protein [Actinomadura sp. NPDC047616]|uniref:SGNH/GDSL hydrolase family protein n=1 Tax=Actinomadura sp. NPDC047616 TaxID=3155914 RepID=UPI0033F75694
MAALPRRLVVFGDSVAEGRDDPDPAGGWIGWAGRLADLLELPRDRVANFGRPAATIADVTGEQLAAAGDARPGLVVLNCGMNDALAGFDRERVAHRVAEVFGWASRAGAVAIAAPVPCPPFLERVPMSAFRRKRTLQRIDEFNAELRQAAEKHDMTFLAPGAVREVADPALWSADGIHLNPAGHAYVAEVIAPIARDLLGERPVGAPADRGWT